MEWAFNMLFEFWIILGIQTERVNDELAGIMNDELYDKLEQYVAESETARQEAFEESVKRRKAEKDAIEARRRVIYSFVFYPFKQVSIRCLIYEKLKFD